MTNNGHTEGSAPVAGMPSNGQRSASGTGLDDPRVHEAMEEYLRLLQAGQRPDRQAFLARFPEVAHALELCLQGLDFVHAAGGELSQPDNSPADLDTGLGGAATLGDFRIGREVGRGGMGVVYEAEQVSLGRRVALKVLPFAGALDPKQLRRFQTEARAAAQLHHTNIVPVHFVGSERGVHFYAMQFIDGQSLAEVIQELRQKDRSQESGVRNQGSGVRSQKEENKGTESPATGPYKPAAAAGPARDTSVVAGLSTERSIRGKEYIRSVARLGIQAAEALEHAHDMGVVHRDVKPANLLLDVDGRLWVTDFGLARLHADAGLTVTGDLVGTLRYMSPEQALAKRVVVDHRTDIYSLGVTLYELLTLRPAYEGSDRQELLRKIAFDEPRPPSRLNKAIPRELETVVLKAAAKSPAERYATAQELADDLRHFLEDKPIRARRPTLVQRARKWARRHPAVMASALVALVLAVVALSVSNLLIARANQQKNLALQDKETALYAAEEAKTAAEQSNTETQAVLKFVEEKVFAAARPEGLEGGLGREVTLRRALEAALPSVAKGFSGQPLTEARLRRTLGLSFRYLGEENIAAQQFQVARTLYTEHRGPDHADTLASINNLANSYAALGRRAEAVRLREETLALRRAKFGPDDPDSLASMSNLANSYHDLGRYTDALRLREETLARRQTKLGFDHPQTLASKNNLAVSYTALGRHTEAVTLCEETLPLMRAKFSQDHPNTLACMHNLAESYHALGRHADALALYEETLALVKAKLGEKHAKTLLVMNNLAWLLATAEDIRFRDPARAVELAANAAQLSPKNADFSGTLGIARYRTGDWKQAGLDLERAIRLRSPGDALNANECFFLAMARWRLGDKTGAREWFDKGVAWMEKGKLRDDELRRFRAEAAVVLGIRDRP